jgi:hypothetical protein
LNSFGSGLTQTGPPTARDNAAVVTKICSDMSLSETSPILQDPDVQKALTNLVYSPAAGDPTTHLSSIWYTDLFLPVRQILLDSGYLINRTFDHLRSYDEPAWKISLSFAKESQRHLLCGSTLEPRGLENAFEDPVLTSYRVWCTHIQPFLDRLDQILSEIYGPLSVRPIILQLQQEQADKVYTPDRGGGGKNPLLVKLVDVCRMWNDTIASYKVQKMLFSEGLEKCE